MTADTTWEPPGPGSWSNDRSHFAQPATGFNRGAGSAVMRSSMARGFARIGIAMGEAKAGSVNGWTYMQPCWADPATYDDLEVAAKDFMQNRRWLDRLADWHEVGYPERLAECRAMQAVGLTALGDEALVDHMDACLETQRHGSRWHFEQHGLCVLIGDLILHTREWGIPDIEVLPLLEGSSPASARTARHLRAIAEPLEKAGVRPATLDDIRDASEAAAAALDEYLELYGMQPVAGFDFDARTLRELPDVIVAAVNATMDGRAEVAPADVGRVRQLVPGEHRSTFDELLDAARAVYGLRDDDVYFSLWGRGLVRRALLESGRRLHGVGLLRDAEHVFELAPDEIRALLVDGKGLSADEVAARATLRSEHALLVPPPVIGDRPQPPPFADMPPMVRRLTEAMVAYTRLRRSSPTDQPLTGDGIGSGRYRGRAVVAANADDAFDRIEPGDILITVLTTPAFNAVLPLCGGLIVEEAGLLSHAAVTARELGIPAVVGVARATEMIEDGAEVELDPDAGGVRIVG